MGLAGPYDLMPLRDKKLKVISGGTDRPETRRPRQTVQQTAAVFETVGY
jgi:hypothetical protein